MKKRDEILFIEDVLLFCNHIAEYTKGLKKSEFLANMMLQDALVRKI